MGETAPSCPDCGAEDGQTCTDHFHLMGIWELDHQLYDVHHLMVLCYHLQHPALLYSPEALRGAKQMLVKFLEEGVTPQAMRRPISTAVDSGKLDYKIKGTPVSHGTYDKPVQWAMIVANVTFAGLDNYYVNVRKWAEPTLKSLRESGNMD